MPTKPTGHKSLADVKSWLERRGFALEHQVVRAFRSAGFSATLGRTYRDRSEQKPHEIDVVARVGPAGASEAARHRLTTPGNPRIDPAHYPERTSDPASSEAEADKPRRRRDGG
jgi:hypothetical protein